MTTSTDGVSSDVETMLAPAECCDAGQADDDPVLRMACEDTEMTVLTWDEDLSLCTQIMTTTTDGVSSDVETMLTPVDCCDAGQMNEDDALRMACEDTVETVLTWDEGTQICTETVVMTVNGITNEV